MNTSIISNRDNNTFPLEVFPSPFKELLEGCERALNFPIDYMGSALLGAVSTATGKSAKVNVKNEWAEYASMYISIVGDSGSNKSHPLAMAFKPIEKLDRNSLHQFRMSLKKHESYLQVPKKQQPEEDRVFLPLLKKTILTNFTPEVLLQRLAENENGCAVVSDELESWLQGMNNYSKCDQTSTYLSLWSNKSVSVDRVKNLVPIYLESPFLTIIGSVQPRLLPKLFPSRKTDNGFLQRFLFAYPDHVEKQPINDLELEDGIYKNYEKWMNIYMNLYISIVKDTPKQYKWSKDAKEFFYTWQKQHTEQVNENLGSLKAEIINKYDIHFIRLSLILQIMTDYKTDEISLSAVQGASKLCAYYLNCAFKIQDILEDCALASNESTNITKNNFFEALPFEFTTRTANQLGKPLHMDLKAVQRFLQNEAFVEKVSHGNYRKKILK